MALGKIFKKAAKLAIPAGAAYFGGPMLSAAGIGAGLNPMLTSGGIGLLSGLLAGQKPKDALLGAGIGALVGGARQPFASDASGLPIGYGRGQVDPKLAKAAITGSVSNVAKNVPEAKTISAELLNALKLGGKKGDENLLFRLLNTQAGQGIAAGLLAEALTPEEETPQREFERRPFGFGGPGGQITGIMRAAEGGDVNYFPRRTGGIGPGVGSGTKDDVPALLMDGEFVMTRDAVKGAGGGDINKGINKMYQMMNDFERMA
tara:strand:- start:296 stop:1081 length:786 start_codon:yes stop_codon:yes gene_type:complete